MTTTSPTTLRIAILVNISPLSPDEAGIKSSFADAFNILAPTVVVNFYDSVIKRKFPDAKKYELVILSGGENLLSGEAWINDVITLVKKARVEAPRTKLFGIC